jgi:hypothetical protein
MQKPFFPSPLADSFVSAAKQIFQYLQRRGLARTNYYHTEFYMSFRFGREPCDSAEHFLG